MKHRYALPRQAAAHIDKTTKILFFACWFISHPATVSAPSTRYLKMFASSRKQTF
jgi:hypothetical protein